jgi:uncharacterized protein (DUF2336 family)
MVPNTVIAELENAIATRSGETGAILRRITDLFISNAGNYTADQLDVYDGVLKLLIANVEVSARAELARRLAPVEKAPVNTMRSLALDDVIDVAEPILTHSDALDDDTLVLCTKVNAKNTYSPFRLANG